MSAPIPDLAALRAMRAVRYLEENRGTPPQRQLARQLARELAAALSELPQQGTRATHSGVRRLTPREAERLQGFPDDWTLIPWNGKPSPDSRRYAALGNAVTVPVAEWIGHRIITADQMEVAA